MRSTAAAVRAGLCGFSEHAYMIDTAGEPMRVARVAGVDDALRGAERLVALLAPALTEALAGVLVPGGAATTARDGRDGRIGVAIALPPARPGGPDDAADAVRALCRERLGAWLGPCRLFASGHAGGFEALDQARAWLRGGQVDAVVVAGVDSYLAPETLEWLEAEEQLHGAGPLNNAWGFILGEAAGALLLARAGETAAGRRLGGRACGRSRPRIEIEQERRGLHRRRPDAALRRALDEMPAGGVIDNVVSRHERRAYRADEYGFCGLRVRDRLRDPTDFLAPADCWGDVGAAGLPLQSAAGGLRLPQGSAKAADAAVGRWTAADAARR